MSDDPRCAKCGHPRSNHPYRHPFVGPSKDGTIKPQADRTAELEAKLAKAMEVVKMIASADVDAVLSQAIDISCEILGELMEDEDDE